MCVLPRRTLFSVVFCIYLLSPGTSAFLLRDCDACGLFRYEMSNDVDGTCEEKCVPFWMAFINYRCDRCSTSPTGLNPSPPTPTAPSRSPPSPIAQTPMVSTPASPQASVPAPKPVSVPMATAPSAVSGEMTMWTSSPSAILGSSCEYAQPVSTAKGASWLVPHVNPMRYCAVSDALYKGGMGCGQCYRVSYSGTGGTDPGRPGSTIIQVVDSGSAKEFDCFLDSFTAITGATTGRFPVQYSPVACTIASPTVVVLDGGNAWYVKVLFAGGATGVKSAKMQIGSTIHTLDRVSGATWKANLNGVANQPVSFVVTYADDMAETLVGCFGGLWPVATSTQCAK